MDLQKFWHDLPVSRTSKKILNNTNIIHIFEIKLQQNPQHTAALARTKHMQSRQGLITQLSIQNVIKISVKIDEAYPRQMYDSII